MTEKKISENSMHFADLLQLWVQQNRVRHKGGTAVKYQFLIESHLIPDLGTLRLDSLQAPRINHYLSGKLEHGRLDGKGGLSPSYVRTLAIIIRAALQFAADEGICQPLRSRICKPPAAAKKITLLDPADQKRLERSSAAAKDPTGVGVMLSLYAGLRIGEVCALRWSDIDMNQRIIHIVHTVARVRNPDPVSGKTALILDTPKTGASRRDIPIPSVLFDVLTRAKAAARSPFVVSDSDSFLSPRTYEYRFHRLLQENGIAPINYHALRHTFATRCVEVGVDTKTLSEILGHANVSITLETYVHSSMKLKQLQLEKLTYIE